MSKSFRYLQLEAWLLQGIQEQRWRLGERLPSIRTLCHEQKLSKATVQHALQRLEAQGLIVAREKAGYFVAFQPQDARQPTHRVKIEAPRLATVNDLLQDIMRRGAAFDLVPQYQSHEDLPPGIVSLNRSIGRALRRQRGHGYQYYDEPAGDPLLREQLVLHHSKRGWAVTADKLCITSGCQHALFLALMACCNRGDVVAVESPGFYGVMQLLEQLGLQVIEIPASADTGIDVDALAEALARWTIKACIVSPAFSTPTGALMPESAKHQLLMLAQQYDLAVIEDDIYGDLSFGKVPDPLKALDHDDRVILCSSFSKSLSRDLRLGWISGARWHDKVLQLKLITQLASSRYLQQGVAEFMADGHFTTHLRRRRNELRMQRDQLISHLQAWPCTAKFSIPQGGLASWVELPESVNTLESYFSLLQKEIVITPGPLFSMSGEYKNCVRISFSHAWDKVRLDALKQLPTFLK